MNRITILTEFKNELVQFFDNLISMFPNMGEFVAIRIFLKDQIPITEIMNIFIQYINKDDGIIKRMIKEKNERFFLEHNIFDIFGKSKVNIIKELWITGELDNDEKEMVWKWIKLFVYRSECYVKSA